MHPAVDRSKGAGSRVKLAGVMPRSVGAHKVVADSLGVSILAHVVGNNRRFGFHQLLRERTPELRSTPASERDTDAIEETRGVTEGQTGDSDAKVPRNLNCGLYETNIVLICRGVVILVYLHPGEGVDPGVRSFGGRATIVFTEHSLGIAGGPSS